MESYAYNSSGHNSSRIPAGSPRGGALDWNAEIRQDDRFTLLPEGDYVFRVLDVDRETFIGSEKLPPCIQANLTMQVETPEGPVRIRENIKLCEQMEWKLCAFFRSIGLKEKGKAVVMDWDRVPGARGRFHTRPRTFPGSDGKQYESNDVTYLDYDASKMPQIEAQRSGFDLKRTSSGGRELPAWVTEARRSGACEDVLEGDQGELPF